MENLVKQQTNGAVLELILNRPDKKNALTLAMYNELIRLLGDAEENTDVRAVLIRAEGNSFSAGNDIGDFMSVASNPDALSPVIQFLHRIAAFKKPLLAAVQGDAVGIGTTLLLHCDLVIAAGNLRCQTPFARLGLVPEGGTTLFLPQTAGHRQAFELLVEGAPFGAERAKTLGLVNDICEPENLLEQARVRAAGIAALPPEAVQLSKAMLKKTYLEQLHQVLDDEAGLFYQRLFSDEARQAFMAFMSKA
ncbi:MAG: enoyl-CoA hydratase/isomerase family protein [Pontibacterium sp.]